MISPSINSWGFEGRRQRSLNVPCSPSAALQQRYFSSPVAPATSSHFRHVGNPPPPLPLSPDFFTSFIIPSGFNSLIALSNALYPPVEIYPSIETVSIELKSPRWISLDNNILCLAVLFTFFTPHFVQGHKIYCLPRQSQL